MLMVCIKVHALRVLYTYSVGYVLLVQVQRQYQSLRKRNSKIAVPLLIFYMRALNPKWPLFSVQLLRLNDL